LTVRNTIKLLPSDIETVPAAGASILEAAQAAGVRIASPCGGKGRCGRCIVLVGESKTPVRACETPAEPGMVVEIPAGAQAGELSILATGISRQTEPEPNVRKVFITPDPPRIGDQRSDTQRILDSLKDLGIATQPAPGGIGGIPRTPREAGWDLTAVVIGTDLVGVEPGDMARALYGIAYDIGTTTIVGYLIDLATAEQVGVASERNPQSPHGEDVVSRIAFASGSERNLKMLQREVVSALNKILRSACRQARVKPESVYEAVAVGNPCMISLSLGVSPEGLTQAPYIAPFDAPQEATMPELGIKGSRFGRLVTLPLVSAFVGADTVGVLLAAGIDEGAATRLAVDIGTNGEIALAHKGRILAAATAAGPAFEGWHISCGTQAVPGAVDHVWVGTDDLEISRIADGSDAVGLCGSGIADAAALMVEEGIVDPSGRLLTRDQARARPPKLLQRIRTDGGDRRSFTIAERISMTQGDVREVQLAKGAIRAGINILLAEAGITCEDIDEVLLAGAFGNYVNRQSALSIGLLPPVEIDKIRSIGNAAGEGAKLALRSTKERERAQKIAESVEYVELSGRRGFEDEFAAAMRLG
jgi:uncharacterized 2Fe-2S/4Fe-4S cluster protein (DUF4445 family)